MENCRIGIIKYYQVEKHTGGEKLMSIRGMINIVLRHVRKTKPDSIYIGF